MQKHLLDFNLSFENLNLQPDFVQSIKSAGYQSPTEFQSQLIPLIGERKNILILNQSIIGKTGAFLIPAINYILASPVKDNIGARILILTSRRDRVSQITYTLKRLTTDQQNMRFGFIVSGRPYQPQMRLMRRSLDIMIATPGRLSDLVDNKKADFSQLEMLIIDDMTTIYQKNMSGLIEKITEQAKQTCPIIAFIRQDNNIKKLARELIPNAMEIESTEEEGDVLSKTIEETDKNKSKKEPIKKKDINTSTKNSLLDHLQHTYVADDYTHKIALMDHFLDEFSGEPTIIYTATQKSATALQDNLANHGHVAALASQLNFEEKSTPDTPILILCDQSPSNLPSKLDKYVIHFDLPFKLDNYKKRLAQHQEGRDSAMIIIADGNDYDALRRIEKSINAPIEQRIAPGLEPLNPFKSTLNNHSRKQSSNQNNKSNAAKKTNAGKKQAPSNGKVGANKNTRSKPHNTKATPLKNKTADNKKRGKTSTSTRSGIVSDDKDQKRQRKGPYGRLNGGAQRKRGDFSARTAGVGGVKNNQPAPMSDSGWDKAIAENNKPTKEVNVTIRHKAKKRTLLKDDQSTDS